jgi:hypothetical protein
MLWMFIFLVHVAAAFLLIKNEESEKRDREKKINSPVIHVAPSRFTIEESGYFDPDRQGKERIARRNESWVEEIEGDYMKIGVLRKLNKL